MPIVQIVINVVKFLVQRSVKMEEMKILEGAIKEGEAKLKTYAGRVLKLGSDEKIAYKNLKLQHQYNVRYRELLKKQNEFGAKKILKKICKNMIIHMLPTPLKAVYYNVTYGVIDNFKWSHPNLALLFPGKKGEWIASAKFAAKMDLGYYKLNKSARAFLGSMEKVSKYGKYINKFHDKLAKNYQKIEDKVLSQESFMLAMENDPEFRKIIVNRKYIGNDYKLEEVYMRRMNQYKNQIKPKPDHIVEKELKVAAWEDVKAHLSRPVNRANCINMIIWIGTLDDTTQEYIISKLSEINGNGEQWTNLKLNVKICMYLMGYDNDIIIQSFNSPMTENFAWPAEYNVWTETIKLSIRGGWITSKDKVHKNAYIKSYDFKMSYAMFIRATKSNDFGKQIYSKMYSYKFRRARPSYRVKKKK